MMQEPAEVPVLRSVLGTWATDVGVPAHAGKIDGATAHQMVGDFLEGLLESRTKDREVMVRDSVTISDVLDLLNSAVKCDPLAMHSLVEHRVSCNVPLAEHDTIQVVREQNWQEDPKSGPYSVGLLGLVNGFFGTNARGWGPISAIYEDGEGGKLLRFERTPDKKEGS